MAQRARPKQFIEALILATLPFGLNLLFPMDPGFLGAVGLPYLVTGIIFAGFSGLAWGTAVGAVAALLGFLVLPAAAGQLGPSWPSRLAESLRFSAPLSVLAGLGMAFFHERQKHFRQALRLRLRKLVRSYHAQKAKADSMERVNRILESRVANQKDSITLLSSQVRRLSSLNLDEALSSLLETVQLFTDAGAASIWTLDPKASHLASVASCGWQDAAGRGRTRSLDASIEGYVYRNGKHFSIRMVLGSAEFTKFDVQNNILCYPIRVRGRVWGVLNIEELPFERYSNYTESVLEILLSLIEPSLGEILEHQALFDQREVDEDSGLPQITQLYRSLQQELGRQGEFGEAVSLIILEISNFDSLLASWGRAELKGLLPRIKQALDDAQLMKSRAFHFKQDNQMALLIAGLDQDGTSFLCLEILSLIPGLGLEIGGQAVPLEIIIGFSSGKEAGLTDEAMIQVAESLLEMQRL